MFSRFIRTSKPSVKAEAAALPVPVAALAWEVRLQAAIGNDMALLALARDAPSIDIKLSAVLALAGEDAMRQAEREFRTHDRRVHSAVKDLYKTQVERRKTRTRADELIRTAESLAVQPFFPANRLVELDHAWRALDANLLDDGQQTKFSDLQQALAKLLRERGEAHRSVSRWAAEARQALAYLGTSHAQLSSTTIELHELLAAQSAAGEKARQTLAALPASVDVAGIDTDLIANLEQSLRTALQDAAAIEGRLMALIELQQSAQQPLGINDGEPATPVALFESVIQHWQALAPIGDRGVENALNIRFEEWRQLQDTKQRKHQADRRQCTDDNDKAAQQVRNSALIKAASGTEEALAAGRLADAIKHMPALQAAVENGDAAPALQARIERLQAEIVRLKGWQHWGSEQARDDLVAEAEALARSTIVVEESGSTKLPIKQIEESIERLRARWKQLDQIGGAKSKATWQRFDGALKIAHVPVAAHGARLHEARLENLATRESLIDALDAIDIGIESVDTKPDWKEIARALAHFQAEWRKLGPLQHTVPHKRQPALAERMKSSVARLEQPLLEIQRGAKAEREQILVRAKALTQNAQDRDVIAKVRELQTQWQQHAKRQPLPRAVENAMWTDFRAAIGTVMNRREEVLKEFSAQLDANRAVREALIARLQTVGMELPVAEIKRILAEVTSEWHKAGEAPRNQAAKLESRFRDACDTVQQWIAGSGQRMWLVTCDTLAGKLVLCEEMEASTRTVPADIEAIEARWAALPTLPSRWEQVLQGRFKAGIEQARSEQASPRHSAAETDDTLNDLFLRLELKLDVPSPAAFEAPRRSLKLLWMKEAMEGRRSGNPVQADINDMVAAVIACKHQDVEQRQRLAAILDALRKSAPAGLRP